MKILIITAALVACAAGAPSGPAVAPIIPIAAAIPTLIATPTISPGDLQAAAIDAKVFAEDQARALQDQARALQDEAKLAVENAKLQTELTTEDHKEKSSELEDQAKEKIEENFWSSEDKKWQALDAVKTAEAQIDGSVANNAESIARASLILPAPLVPAPVLPQVIPGLTPLVYSPGIVAPALKPEKLEKGDNLIKSGEKTEEKGTLGALVQPILTPLGLAPAIKFSEPWVSPIAYIQPGLPAQLPGFVLSPVVKKL